MTPLNRSLGGNDNNLPVPEDILPVPPAGYEWEEWESGNWRYLHKINGGSVLWAVRNMEGKLCMGVMNHYGYTIEPEEYDTIILTLLVQRRMGIGTKTH